MSPFLKRTVVAALFGALFGTLISMVPPGWIAIAAAALLGVIWSIVERRATRS